MGGRGSSSRSASVGFGSSPSALRAHFAERLGKEGAGVSVGVAGASPSERSKVAEAMNLAAGDVFGASSETPKAQLSRSLGTGVRFASFGGVKVPVSESPSDAELRGAYALARKRKAGR